MKPVLIFHRKFDGNIDNIDYTCGSVRDNDLENFSEFRNLFSLHAEILFERQGLD